MTARRCCLLIVTALAAAALFAPTASIQAQLAKPDGDRPVVEVVAEDYAFDAPATIPSGWATIRFRNVGQEPHMIFLTRLPEGKTIEEYETDLSAQFSRAPHAVRDEGLAEDKALETLFGSLPDWFGQVQFVGGPG